MIGCIWYLAHDFGFFVFFRIASESVSPTLYIFIPTPANILEVQSGNLTRSFRRAPKGAKDAHDEGDDELEGAGICHLCLGGHQFEWENLPLC